MIDTLHELGLGPDADARAVKRAYAARLKTTRPDADPEGFQALNEAYQAALAWIAANAAEAPSEATQEARQETTQPASAAAETQRLSAPETAPAPDTMHDSNGDFPHDDDTDASTVAQDDGDTVETVRFDVDGFLERCASLAAHSRDGELSAWLNAQPILWSLQHKAQLGQWLLQYLYQQRPPIEGRRFDVLAGFFGLLELNSGYDAYHIQRLRHRLHLAWEVQRGHAHALADRTGMDSGSIESNLRQITRILKQIQWPLNMAQVLCAGLMPAYPTAIRRFLHRLDFGNLDDLPAPINPAQVAFWNDAADRSRFSKPRWAILAARWLAYTLAITLAITLAFVLLTTFDEFQTVGIVGLAFACSKVAAASFVGLLLLWLTSVAHKAFNEWQALPESDTTRQPWLRTSALPLLAVATLTADRLFDLGAIGVSLSTIIFLLALHRYRRRSGLLFGGKYTLQAWHIVFMFVAVVVLNEISDHALGFLTMGIIGGAIVLWATDVRRQRAALGT